jgi:hypothetical protein
MARARDLVGDRPELPPIERAPRDARLPLSFAQQGLWFVEQLGSLGATYHMPVRRALDGIVARHEALRTTFTEVDGIPRQRIAPAEASRFPPPPARPARADGGGSRARPADGRGGARPSTWSGDRSSAGG